MAANIIKENSPPIQLWVLPVMENELSVEAEGEAPELKPLTTGKVKQQLSSPPARDINHEIITVRKEAYQQGYKAGSDTGFKKGYEQGIDDGLKRERARTQQNELFIENERQHLQSKTQHLEQLLTVLGDPVSQLDKEVEDQLVGLVLAVSRQLIRRELKTDPGQIIAVVRKAVSLLPVATREYRLALHPEDAVLVREALAMDDNEGDRPWTIVEDPVLTRGGCQVVSEISYIDATVERQLAAVAASLLGDERGADE